MPETDLKEVKTDIANLLGWFDCEMSKEWKVDWGLVGQMEATRSWLIGALSVMSNGISVREIFPLEQALFFLLKYTLRHFINYDILWI